ncbi:translin-associated factor X-interacting protein 1-like [Oratosquilla oratoria]|uniref:translin-associated factor X-interacting protein 1-like n=1 Tax=Oratosquilla oratoria TaxID=337810 RepID=UPI003F75FA4F
MRHSRPSSDVLSLVRHGYDHIVHILTTRLMQLQFAEEFLNPSKAKDDLFSYAAASRIADLERRNRHLQEELDGSRRQVASLQQDVDKAEAAASSERAEALLSAEKLVTVEVDLVRTRLEAGALSHKLKRHNALAPDRNPELLTIALQKCREELSLRTRRMQDIERLYRHVVPRADFERLQRRMTSLTANHDAVSSAFSKLRQEHDDLLGTHEGVANERDSLSAENNALRRTATPRPDWNRVAEYVEGGIARWREVSSGRTSDQLVDVLVAELTGSHLSTSNDFIACKGFGEDVPHYLRYDGTVRNRRLGKRDVTLIIEDIWHHRTLSIESSSSSSFTTVPMHIFVDEYFRERYHLEEVRAEWCYSLADACQRLAHEEQVGLFWGILCGQVQEEVHHHQTRVVHQLREALRAKDKEGKGVVTKGALDAALREIFPLKSDINLQVVMGLASRASLPRDPNLVKFDNLFASTTPGGRSALAQELATQARDEQDAYIQDLLDELGYSALDVSVAELRRAFTVVDPRIEQRELDSYLSWVFNAAKENLKDCPTIPLTLLAARLQTGHIVRVGERA